MSVLENGEEKMLMQIEIIKNTISLFGNSFVMCGNTESELAIKAILQQIEELERIIIINTNLYK